MRTGIGAVLCSVLICSSLTAQSVKSGGDAPKGNEPDKFAARSEQQVQRALQIAKLAAENGMQKLSLRAVSDSLSGGPPFKVVLANSSTVTTTLSGIRLAPPVSRSRSSSKKPVPSPMAFIQQELQNLNTLWKAKQFDPDRVYETLTNVVLPPGRPEEVFCYEQTVSSAALKSTSVRQAFNGGRLLVEWAQLAGRTEDLSKRLEERKTHRRAQISATVVHAMLYDLLGQTKELKQQLGQLRMYLVQSSTGRDAELAAQLAFPLLGSTEVGTEAASVAEKVMDQIITGSGTNRNYHVEPATSILKTIANTYVKAGDEAKVRESVARLLNVNSIYNKRYNRSSSNYVQRLRQAQVNTAAAIFLNAGMFSDAAPLMAEYYELQAVTGRTIGTSFGPKLFHLLMMMEPEARYELLLKFCLTESGAVNQQCTFTPRHKPLPIFASTVAGSGIGQQFHLPEIGVCRDVVDSGALLAKTARETGHLDDLVARLESMADKSPTNLDSMVFFARMESKDVDFAVLRDILAKRTKSLRELASSAETKIRINRLTDYTIAVRAAEIPELRAEAEQLMDVIVTKAKNVNNAEVRAHARRAMEVARVLASKAPDLTIHQNPNLKHWHVADCDVDTTHVRGDLASIWLAHDGFIRNISAPQDGLLYFRYPLVGDFEVSAHVTEGNWSEGGLVYDGLLTQSQGFSKEILALHISRPARKSPKVNLAFGGRTKSQISLQVSNDKSTFRLNRHKAFVADVTGSSPFVALKSSAGYTPGFRNLRISGDPKIPREVHLLKDHRLCGWAPYFSSEQVCSVFAKTDSSKGSAWTLADGVLQSPRDSAVANPESHLIYQRPLQTGEKVRWEFQYTRGLRIAHPAMGRLAFLLQPDGVQLHWITDGEREWSGVPSDNAVTEKSSQRGPAKLPFIEDGWNKAELSLDGAKIQLSLNGQVIMDRDHEAELQTQFGFYHDRTTEEVAVRNVVLTGDWPATFAEATTDGLLAPENPDRSLGQNHLAAEVIGSEEFSEMGYQVARDAERLPPKDRLEVLKRWVLPGDHTLVFRDQGGFVPGPQVPDAATMLAELASPGQRRPGAVASPALDLVFVAAELGQLDELKNDVRKAAMRFKRGAVSRSMNSILSVIATAQGDFDTANGLLKAVLNDVIEKPQKAERYCWAELSAAWNALHFPETKDSGIRILDYMVEKQFNAGRSPGWEFDQPIRAIRGLGRATRDIAVGLGKPLRANGNWQPTSHFRANVSAAGIGDATWTENIYGGVTHHSGHSEDFLFYGVPLRGNFTVECELTSFNWREIRLMYADHWVGVNSSKKQYDHGRAGFELPKNEFTSTPMDIGAWYRCRMEVKDGVYSHWVNGTKIFEEKLSAVPDPWLALRCASYTTGSVRNLKISGTPTIPQELELTKQTNLRGWMATHFRQSMRFSGADWIRSGSFIVGAKRTDQALTQRESLLQYHRPMLEDGEFEYNFVYDDKKLVHPAMGRLVFLLHPDGVSEHVVTNGVHETGILGPDNSAVIAANQIRSSVPLTDGTNHMKVKLVGDEILLTLNGIDIYKRTLSPNDQRYFGFFHYPGITEARISDIVYRGDWGTTLPPESKQQFSKSTDSMNLQVDEKDPSKFIHHDFVKSGLPDELFPASANPIDDNVKADATGIRMSVPPARAWTSKTFSPHFALEGDFDVTVAFAEFKATPPDDEKSSGIQLGLKFANGETVEILRRLRTKNHFLESMWVSKKDDGRFRYDSNSVGASPAAGRLRISRRANIVLWMFAPEGSDEFQITRTETVTDAPVLLDSIDFEGQIGGNGTVSVVWKDFTIRADSILKTNPKPHVKPLKLSNPSKTTVIDFAADGIPADLISRSGDRIVVQKNGVHVTRPGSNSWEEAWLSPEFGLAGDFDVSVDFTMLKVETPSVSSHSGAHLLLQFDSPEYHRIDIHTVETRAGVQQVAIVEAFGNGSEKRQYLLRGSFNVNASEVVAMQVTRTGEEMAFSFVDSTGKKREVARRKVTTEMIRPKGIRLMVHTGGKGKLTEVLWKKLTVRGAHFTK